MSLWTVLNILAWVLCGVIALFLISDAVRVEKRKNKNKDSQGNGKEVMKNG